MHARVIAPAAADNPDLATVVGAGQCLQLRFVGCVAVVRFVKHLRKHLLLARTACIPRIRFQVQLGHGFVVNVHLGKDRWRFRNQTTDSGILNHTRIRIFRQHRCCSCNRIRLGNNNRFAQLTRRNSGHEQGDNQYALHICKNRPAV